MDNNVQNIFTVILNWNRADLTAKCIESVIKHSPEVRIIVVDNGSTDESVPLLRKLFPAVTIIENGKNLGFGAGNNPGIQYALDHGAGYVWLLNNDVTTSSSSLSEMLEKFTISPETGIVGSAVYDMAEPEKLLALGGGIITPGRSYAVHCSDFFQLKDISYITGSSMLIKADVLNKTGLFDEKFFMYWEDADLCFRAGDAGYKIAVACKSKILHANGSSSKDSALKSYYIFKSGLHFQKKHYDTKDVINYLLCFTTDVLLRDLLTGKFGHAYKLIWLILLDRTPGI